MLFIDLWKDLNLMLIECPMYPLERSASTSSSGIYRTCNRYFHLLDKIKMIMAPLMRYLLAIYRLSYADVQKWWWIGVF
jgi:hypothetical protein